MSLTPAACAKVCLIASVAPGSARKASTSVTTSPIHPSSCAGAKAKVVWLLLLELLVLLELLEELLVVVELVVSVQEVVLKVLLLVVLLVLDDVNDVCVVVDVVA